MTRESALDWVLRAYLAFVAIAAIVAGAALNVEGSVVGGCAWLGVSLLVTYALGRLGPPPTRKGQRRPRFRGDDCGFVSTYPRSVSAWCMPLFDGGTVGPERRRVAHVRWTVRTNCSEEHDVADYAEICENLSALTAGVRGLSQH